MKRYLGALCLVFAFFVENLGSQNTAALFGTVTDASGAVIPGAELEAKRLPSGPIFKTIADSLGHYRFEALVTGEYEVRAYKAGFAVYAYKLRLDTTTPLQMNFTLQVGQTSETVTVEASALPLNTSSSSLGRARPERIPAHGIRQRHLPFNTAEYDYYVENEFTTVKASPLSTFSVDVDTASYSNVRRFLMEGSLPPAGAVRIEELINYFTYDYTVPEEGKPVSMTTHVTSCPWNTQRQLLHVGLRTKPIPWEKLPPSNLTFLIDVSGSMMPQDRLPLIKKGLQLLVQQLRPEDRVALVVYAGNAGVVLPPTSGSEQQTILDAIGRLEAGGSTNGYAGIRTAYDLARQFFVKHGNNRVILATDGDFNVGVSSDSDLVTLIEKERDSGIFLSVLGVGRDNLKDSRMEKLADHGNGNYAYLDSLAEARKVLVQQMGGTLVTVAKDVKLQIEFNPDYVKAWRLIGYENRVLRPEEFNDDKKDAGDLGAGHQVTAIYELLPASSQEETARIDRLRYQQDAKLTSKSRAGELAWIKLRHKKPDSNKSELLEWPVSANAIAFLAAPPGVRFAASVAEYGMLLRQSKFAGNASLDHVLHTAKDALGDSPAGTRAEFLDLVHRAKELSKNREVSER